jgi:AraC-like DNA-binding protein
MQNPDNLEPRGLLSPKTGQEKFQLTLHHASPDLAQWIEYYWVVRWDLRGQEPYRSENLSHPSVHIVIERGKSGVFGVITGKFVREVRDEGRAFGIKFKPGAFHLFSKMPVSGLTDQTIGLDVVFGADGQALEAKILALKDDADMVEAAECFIRARLPQTDDIFTLIASMVEAIMTDGTIIRVDDLAARFNISKRSLQRNFNEYIGVGPKWVIQRYRLHEAAEKLARGEVDDWPTLALNLGYFDQAHFIKDFKAIVGKTPAEYIRQL